jgi:hypothetical protein
MSEDGNSAEGAAEAARKLVEPAPRTFGEFLESVPPAQLVKVTHLWGSQRQSGSSSYKQLLVPDIQLHCTSNDCNALRFYRFEGGETNLYRGENLLDTFITYRCSNCRSSGKIFSLHAEEFSKAVESAKDAIPQSLLINGQNPLTLLYSALSIGIHEQTDEKCLELAHDVRVVLVELSERLGQALKDEAELDSAVSRLMKARQDKSE